MVLHLSGQRFLQEKLTPTGPTSLPRDKNDANGPQQQPRPAKQVVNPGAHVALASRAFLLVLNGIQVEI